VRLNSFNEFTQVYFSMSSVRQEIYQINSKRGALFDSIRAKHMPVKRIFDILFSVAVMVMGFPVFFLLALAVRLSSPGNIIYGHKRVGRSGKLFYCYKFRTMYSNSDKRLEEILSSDPALQKEWDETHKLKNDPRITPIGSFLRKTSLDELPQFLNVLKGDLSVVGPRAMVEEEIEKFIKQKAKKILSIRPGLTGIWQTSGRSDTSYKRRILLDEYYVDNHNLFMDCKLIAKTVPVMLFSKGAY
jgi:exopolysaccharide production protein ExoY